MRAFAISDIHGCNATFQSLLDKLEMNTSDKLFFLGDYIDRGPDSKGVVDTIIHLQNKGFDIVCLKGNHEDQFHAEPYSDEWFSWLIQGGKETLESFMVGSFEQLDDKYKKFFNDLDYYSSYNGYLLVHAGFNFENDNPFDDKKAMLWIRDVEYDAEKVNNRRIVHGHTPGKFINLLEAFKQGTDMINIDCGCVYKENDGMGYLCAFELNSSSFYIQKNIDEY